MQPDLLDEFPEQRTLDLRDAQSAGEVLDRIRDQSRTEVEKGTWFENLFARVARNEPELELDEIWRWADWPEREDLTGLDGRDIGVDLVAKHHDGTWIAIQCKCYERDRRISKADIQKFVTGSQHRVFGLRWIVTTCRCGPTAEAVIKGSNVRRIDFLNYHDRLVSEKVERPIQQPWPLQEEAIRDVVDGLQHHDRGRMIMACGTGKTFTSLRIAEHIVPDGGAILFLAPTIALVSQARREWLKHTTRKLSCIVVCSDPYAGGKNEEEDISLSEIECPVTSNPEEIARKLAAAKDTKAVFCTYQSLMQVCEAQTEHGVEQFALTIADEAHRTPAATARTSASVTSSGSTSWALCSGRSSSNSRARRSTARYRALDRLVQPPPAPRDDQEPTSGSGRNHVASAGMVQGLPVSVCTISRIAYGSNRSG